MGVTYTIIEHEENNENKFWTETKKKLMDETDVSIFKTWETIRSIPMYNPNEFFEYYCPEVEAMLGEPSDLWKIVLKEPFYGHTEESYKEAQQFAFDGTVECTPWTLKSAHHILTFEKIMDKSILDYDQIVDFGSGIGETARMILDLGFTGDYYLYDLPETARIPLAYLKNYSNVKAVDHYNDIPSNKKTLFIGTWSLSEVPYKYRAEIAKYFTGQDFLIIFQNQVFKYNNLNYFLFEFPIESGTFVRFEQIKWHGGGNGNFYLIGTKPY